MTATAALTWSHPARLLRLALLVALFCWASIVLTHGDGRVAAIWLSNGLLLGLVLGADSRHWAGMLAAGYIGNVVANLGAGDSLHMALLLSACNSAEILLAAWPLRRRFGATLSLTTAAALLYFTGFALLLAPAASALLASLLLAANGGASVLGVFTEWYPADAMGMLILAPLLLALKAQADLPTQQSRLRDAWLPWLLLVSIALLVFSQERYPLLFLVFPPLLVLSYLRGMRGSVLGVVTLTVIAVIATIDHHGPFMLIDTTSMHIRVLLLQVFIAIAAAQGLMVGMLLAQRERLGLALQRSEQNMRTITDNLPALIAYIDADERYQFVNAHTRRVFGDDPSKLLGRTLREVRGDLVYADIGPRIAQALRGEASHFESHGMANGKAYHYQANYIPDVDSDGAVKGVYAMTFDITDRKTAELKQAADEERLRTITNNLPALIAYLDPQGIYRFCNQTHADWFGKPLQDWLGSDYRLVIDDAFADAQTPHLQAALKGQRIDTELTLVTLGTSRTLRASYLPHLAGDGRVLGVYLLMNDITSLKNVQAELHRLARHDALTGLANRREFTDRLENTIARNRGLRGQHALMFLDIDHFKAINDAQGHATGDAVLCALADRLQASVRHIDTVARLAGDEFVVILDNLHHAEEPQFVARKIIAAMEKPVLFEGRVITVTVSIGIAFDGLGALGPDELLSLADSALYSAKAAGRNTYRLADSLSAVATAATFNSSAA